MLWACFNFFASFKLAGSHAAVYPPSAKSLWSLLHTELQQATEAEMWKSEVLLLLSRGVLAGDQVVCSWLAPLLGDIHHSDLPLALFIVCCTCHLNPPVYPR